MIFKQRFSAVEEYIQQAQREFATRGFAVCPLNRFQLSTCHLLGVKPDYLWGIGCDVAAGVPFDRAFAIALQRQKDDENAAREEI